MAFTVFGTLGAIVPIWWLLNWITEWHAAHRVNYPPEPVKSRLVLFALDPGKKAAQKESQD